MVEIKERRRKYDYDKIIAEIQSIVSEEDKRFPLADRAIQLLILERGVDCTQATVTQLRRKAGISASHDRRKRD